MKLVRWSRCGGVSGVELVWWSWYGDLGVGVDSSGDCGYVSK